MTTIQTAHSKVDRYDTSPAGRWTPAGRWLAAGTLVLASALQLGSHLLSPTLPTADRLVAWAAANPETATLMKVLDIAVLPVLFGTALVYVLLSRRGSPRLASAGGALLGLGLVGLSAWEGAEALALTLAQDGRADLTVVGALLTSFVWTSRRSRAIACRRAMLFFSSASRLAVAFSTRTWR